MKLIKKIFLVVVSLLMVFIITGKVTGRIKDVHVKPKLFDSITAMKKNRKKKKRWGNFLFFW